MKYIQWLDYLSDFVFYLLGKIDRILVKPKTKMARIINLIENAIRDTRNINQNFTYFSIWPVSVYISLNPGETYISDADMVTLNKYLERYDLQARMEIINPAMYLISVFPREKRRELL